MSEWQPIETAPKDVARILVVADGIVRTVGVGTKNAGNLYWCEAARTYVAPTHWMPLPEPPK